MRFTLIIIHRNGYKKLKTVINSAIEAVGNDDEIYIVDNNSQDGSIDAISDYLNNNKIQIIRNHSNMGYGFAANQAMRKGKGNFFLICNNDIKFNDNILDILEKDFGSSPKACMISGQLFDFSGNVKRTYHDRPTFLSELNFLKFKKHYKVPDKITRVENLTGACLAVRKNILDKVGYYDEDFFFYFEETEWCSRIINSGYEILIDPSIRIEHIGGATSSSFRTRARIEFFKSRTIFWKKYFSKLKFTALYLLNIPLTVLDIFIYLFLTFLTLGLNRKVREKFLERSMILLYIVMGHPKSWGITRD